MLDVLKLKKWHEVYPHGTKTGDEERRLFTGNDGKSGLARGGHSWRSVDALSKESKLSKDRVEEILEKYARQGMVIQKPDSPEFYGYWERVAPDANKTRRLTIVEEDQQRRLSNSSGTKQPAKKKKAAASSPSGSGSSGSKSAPAAAPAPAQTAPATP